MIMVNIRQIETEVNITLKYHYSKKWIIEDIRELSGVYSDISPLPSRCESLAQRCLILKDGITVTSVALLPFPVVGDKDHQTTGIHLLSLKPSTKYPNHLGYGFYVMLYRPNITKRVTFRSY